jgi:Iap family predicted aminopeptidase
VIARVVALALMLSGCSDPRAMSIIAAGLGGAASAAPTPVPAASNGFLKRQFVSGTNKVCVYDQLGSDVYVTLPSVELCPLTR